MNWESFSDFIQMGKHGFYVWSSYGVTALFLAIEILLVRRKRQVVRKRLARLARLDTTLEK
ncbi:MAG: heme exporter protein CcmD [Gammaproteobacteria bacterium RBG_16_57_12]|nr:MAG: heme exporter protein CcmD [Gammaproteobacteria bacterium RBG_16_57_12]